MLSMLFAGTPLHAALTMVNSCYGRELFILGMSTGWRLIELSTQET